MSTPTVSRTESAHTIASSHTNVMPLGDSLATGVTGAVVVLAGAAAGLATRVVASAAEGANWVAGEAVSAPPGAAAAEPAGGVPVSVGVGGAPASVIVGGVFASVLAGGAAASVGNGAAVSVVTGSAVSVVTRGAVSVVTGGAVVGGAIVVMVGRTVVLVDGGVVTGVTRVTDVVGMVSGLSGDTEVVVGYVGVVVAGKADAGPASTIAAPTANKPAMPREHQMGIRGLP